MKELISTRELADYLGISMYAARKIVTEVADEAIKRGYYISTLKPIRVPTYMVMEKLGLAERKENQ